MNSRVTAYGRKNSITGLFYFPSRGDRFCYTVFNVCANYVNVESSVEKVLQITKYVVTINNVNQRFKKVACGLSNTCTCIAM